MDAPWYKIVTSLPLLHTHTTSYLTAECDFTNQTEPEAQAHHFTHPLKRRVSDLAKLAKHPYCLPSGTLIHCCDIITVGPEPHTCLRPLPSKAHLPSTLSSVVTSQHHYHSVQQLESPS